MSRHVPLYQALMALVRAIAVTSSLSPLFLSNEPTKSIKSQENQNDNIAASDSPSTTPNLASLLTKMKTTVNTYITKLKWKSGKPPSSTVRMRKNLNMTNLTGDEKPIDASELQPIPEEIENEDQGLSLLVPDIQLSIKVVEVILFCLFSDFTKLIVIRLKFYY